MTFSFQSNATRQLVFQFVISPTEMNMRWRMETEHASTSQVW